jgi:hypothetical protein
MEKLIAAFDNLRKYLTVPYVLQHSIYSSNYMINVIWFVRSDLLCTSYWKWLEFNVPCSPNLSYGRTHVTKCSRIHAQESEVPSVLVFPSHCFVTLAFSYILPVPPNSVTFIHTAIWYYRNSTNRGLPVHWSRRSFEVSHRIPTFTGQIVIAIFNGQAVRDETERLSPNVGDYQSRLCNIPKQWW